MHALSCPWFFSLVEWRCNQAKNNFLQALTSCQLISESTVHIFHHICLVWDLPVILPVEIYSGAKYLLKEAGSVLGDLPFLKLASTSVSAVFLYHNY